MHYISVNRILEEFFSLFGGRGRYVAKDHQGDTDRFMKALYHICGEKGYTFYVLPQALLP